MAPGQRAGLAGLILFALCQFPMAHANAWGLSNDTGTDLRVTPQGDVTQLVVDPHDGQIIYAGTGSNGVYRSDNGGATWQQTAKGLPDGAAITGMVADTTHQGVVYAATPKGVFKTTKEGATWASQGPPTSAGSTSIALVTGSAGAILAGTAG